MSKKKKVTITITAITSLIVAGLIVIFCIYTPKLSDFVSGLIKKNSENTELKGLEQAESDGKNESLGNEQLPLGNPEKNEEADPGEKETEPAALEGVREIVFSGLQGHERLKSGDCIDIRIRYPNGEEYVIVKNLKVLLAECETEDLSQYESGSFRVFLSMTELSQLYLSSALYDIEKYEKTLIYPATICDRVKEAETTGNYRPCKDLLTEISEEGLLEQEEIDEIFLARERLENRLFIYSIGYMDKLENGVLEGGFLDDTNNGYWVYE